MDVEERTDKFRDGFARLKSEIGKVIVGLDEVVDGVLTCLFADGHALLEGVPGLGKTLLIRTLGDALSLKFSRIQFTPDLMPADIIGTNFVAEDADGKKFFEFQQGPIFGQIILADEINRATPKTQSALLEAMQEHRVTVGGTAYPLEEPFLVLATQNPLEMEGTYPLPEAQLDRFLLKLHVPYPSRDELAQIIFRTTEKETPQAEAIMNPETILESRRLLREVPIADHVRDYAIRLVLTTHPDHELGSEEAQRFVRYGSSPRGVQALVLSGKVKAILDGRYNVSFQDIRESALSALRHRLILNFEAEAEGVSADAILDKICEETPTAAEAEVA